LTIGEDIVWRAGSADNSTDRTPELKLTKLAEGLPGITPAFGSALAEAGAVCFEDQNHPNGVELKVDGAYKVRCQVYWQKVTDQMLRCWHDLQDATEYAAYGLALLLICNLTKYTIISRARKNGGFDFWLGEEEDEEQLPFQNIKNKARLEISGILRGKTSLVKARVKQKLKQVEPSDSPGFTAYIVVVEFSSPLSQVVRK
jgi:hypothetical protein